VTITGEGDPVTPAAVEEAAVADGALLARVTDHRTIGGDATEAAPDVDFADPDAAVRERVQEMDLSALGRRLDGTIRDDAVPDSNVRDRVASAVGEAVDDDALGDLLDEGTENGEETPEDADGTAGASDDADETNGASDDDGQEQVSVEEFL
jgi:hypothetical protein